MAVQDLRPKKIDGLESGIVLAEDTLDLLNRIDEWVRFWMNNGFHDGAANALTQDDIISPGHLHLTPAVVEAFRAGLVTVATAAAPLQDEMRRMARKASLQRQLPRSLAG